VYKAVILVNGRAANVDGVESLEQSRNVANYARAEPLGVDRFMDRVAG
jgi:hypothetical protein